MHLHALCRKKKMFLSASEKTILERYIKNERNERNERNEVSEVE